MRGNYRSVSHAMAHEVKFPAHIIGGSSQNSPFAERQLWNTCVNVTDEVRADCSAEG